MKGKTAIIGDGESILAFKAVGVTPFPVKTPEEAADIISSIAKTYGIIFVTDDIAAAIDEKIARFNSQAYPIIVSVPSKAGSNGYGERKLIEATEKALGIDLFSSEEK